MNQINHIIYYGLILSSLILGKGKLLAQDDCTRKLIDAEKKFSAGLIEQVKPLLLSCLKSGFSQEERLKAYKLLILTSIHEDNQIEAKEYMLQFLRKYPAYELNSSDPIEFFNLYKSYRTDPIFSLSLIIGTNAAFPALKEQFGVHNTRDRSPTYGPSGIGTQVGLLYEKKIHSYIHFNVGMFLLNRKYKYSLNPLEFTGLSYKEEQTIYQLPVAIDVFYPMRRWRPYFKFGGFVGLLAKDEATFTREYKDNTQPSVTGKAISMMPYRKSADFGILTGLGAKYKIKRGFLKFEVQYQWALNTEEKKGTRFFNSELIYKYFFLEDRIFVDNFMVNIGIIYSFYKPILK